MSGHTPGLPSVIHPCPTTAEEQERMRDRAWTDLRNADPTLHAEIVRRWNAHADLVAALRDLLCEHVVTTEDEWGPFTGTDSAEYEHGVALRNCNADAAGSARALLAAIAKAGGA